MFNKDDNKYYGYIYKITNIINNKVYIGQTTNTVKQRWTEHRYAAKRGGTAALYNAIRKYGVENFSVEKICSFSFDTEEELHKRLNKVEIEKIAEYDSLKNGYNMTIGGDATYDCRMPVDVYTIDGEFIKTFDSRKSTARYFNIKSEGIVSKICRGEVGNFNQKYVFRNKGEAFDLYDIKTFWYKDIYQFDLEGSFIKKYHSRVEVMNDYGKNFMSENIDHPNRTYCGYWFGSTKEFKFEGNLSAKSVDLYSYDGEFIKTYPSANACAKDIGVSNSDVSSVCRGNTCTVRPNGKKYITRYTGDSFDKYPRRRIYGQQKFVNKYSLDNEFVATYKSMTEAMDSLNLNKKVGLGALSLRCNEGNGKPYYGYIWYFANDQNQPDKTKIINR